MLKHLVLFTFKAASSKNEITQIVDSFIKLERLIPEILEIESGINVSPENYHQGFTHCFCLTFESLDTLASYQINVHHIKFQRLLQEHMEKVFVVDYYVN